MAPDINALTDRLLADAIATSLRSRAAFNAGATVVALDDVIQHLRARAKAYRNDVLASEADTEHAVEDVLREWRRLMPPGSKCRTVTTLLRLARHVVDVRGSQAVLRVHRSEPGREILQWRFFSLALPPELFVAVVDSDGRSADGKVHILDRSIAPDGPVAQHHVHHAAMMSFEDLWASLRLRALLSPGAFARSIRDKRAFCPHLHRGPCDLSREPAVEEIRFGTERAKHMTAWADLMRQAFIARRILDLHSIHNAPLAVCGDRDCGTVARQLLAPFTSGRTRVAVTGLTRYPWPDELARVARDYRKARARSEFERSSGEWLKLLNAQTADERAVLRRSFAKVRANDVDSGDPLFERLFVQYLRVKTAVFGLLVHQPGEHGLRKFLEHFTQIKVYAPEAESLRPRQPLERGLDVQATEYRVAPDAWLKLRRDARRKRIGARAHRPAAVNEIEEQVIGSGPLREAAWIIHFKRSDPGKGLPLYGADIRQIESDGDRIVRALSARPDHLRWLRAIDVCGVEDAQPLWVSAPTLRRVRRSSWRIATGRPALEPLKLSVHAGEDFLWLTSGTRAIAEPFEWQLIERGDRIGHAIAVTLEPNGWWERWNGRVIAVKRIDRLLDLAFLAAYAERRTAEEEQWLRAGLENVVSELRLEKSSDGGDADLLATSVSFWQCLGSQLPRRLMSSSTPLSHGDELHERWLYSYLWNRSTQSRAAEILHLKVGDDRFDDVMRQRTGSPRAERDLLVKARKRLIRQLARWQVCIESNPTSNLVVGSLDAMAAQDFLQRRPTEVCAEGDETLTWTISTDDPITFSTTLADEYAYAWAGMVLRSKNPYDPAYARALLDEAAATSMRMRFTIPIEADDPDNQQPRTTRGRRSR